MLAKDLIADPTRHRLSLLIDPRRVDVAVYAPSEDSSLIYRSIELDPAAKSPQAALEDAIYDNPLLLSQFRRIDCLIDSERFVIVPRERVAEAPDMLAALYGDERFETLCDTIDNSGATLATAVPRSLMGFLKRTFATPRISHRLTPLCRYFGHRTRFGNSGQLHVHLREGACDIIAVASQGIVVANTFRTSAAADAAYFTLAVAREIDFDADSDRILVSGNSAQREELMATLRRYVAFVMPLIFPSDMLRVGREAMDAPFELIAGALAD